MIRAGRIADVRFGLLDVTTDEAASLAAGPSVYASPCGGDMLPDGTVTLSWWVWVTAFVPEEACGAVDDLQEVLDRGRWQLESVPAAYRLQAGWLARAEDTVPSSRLGGWAA